MVKAGLFETCMHLMGPHMMQYAVTGKPAAPMPNRLSAWAVYDIFDLADGQVFIGVVTDTQWAVFCREFDLHDLAGDPALATNRDRVLARDSFMPRLRALFATRQRAEVLATCERIGLPFAPINRPEDMFDDPHLNHPGAMVDVTLASGALARAPALPLEIDGERPGLRLDVPGAGAHSAELCRELGLDEAEIAALFEAGDVTGPTAPARSP